MRLILQDRMVGWRVTERTQEAVAEGICELTSGASTLEFWKL